ncbi:thymidylate kinase [Plasmodium fragile]|uniref:dTMP kinase n=1 Tax=Plasmodium fragile TaxID=5857 RepID=A0A0D9QLC0_PLAFR|nr:thymidylate kinase [Plasmodium fragile]KJP87572.1 thymidylate kinase [Plasmodium fragile]
MDSTNSSTNDDTKKKGKFIVFEGLDRLENENKMTFSNFVGKIDSVEIASRALEEEKCGSPPFVFPKETPTGQIIAKYLKMQTDMTNETIHLLFSANRWELMGEIKSLLAKGVWVVCDRYAYSGVAYSAGALKLSKAWCMNPDQGLIKPDVVFYLNVPPNYAQNRSEYGEEIYEKVEVQKRIYETYKNFSQEDYWINLDGTKNIDDIHQDVVNEITKLDPVREELFTFLWS